MRLHNNIIPCKRERKREGEGEREREGERKRAFFVFTDGRKQLRSREVINDVSNYLLSGRINHLSMLSLPFNENERQKAEKRIREIILFESL